MFKSEKQRRGFFGHGSVTGLPEPQTEAEKQKFITEYIKKAQQSHNLGMDVMSEKESNDYGRKITREAEANEHFTHHMSDGKETPYSVKFDDSGSSADIINGKTRKDPFGYIEKLERDSVERQILEHRHMRG